MQLSQKRKIFSQILFPFSKFRFNFEQFQKKDDHHSLKVFLDLRTPKNVVRSMSKKVPFQRILPEVTW